MSEDSQASVVPQIDPSAAPQAPEVKSTEHIDKFASKFAALTRKEKESTEKWKAKDAEYATKLAEIEEKAKKYAPLENLDKELSTDKRKALDFLLSKGLTVDEIGQMLMDEANPDPETKLKRSMSESEAKMQARIDALEKSLIEKEERKKSQEEEDAKKHHEKIVQGVMTDLTEFVNKSEDYELIRNYNNVDMVYQVMNAHYLEQVDKGVPDQLIKILSYKEACDAVEAHLEEDVTKKYEAKRARQSPKEPKQEPKQATQTLSNTQSSEVPVSGERQLSKEERLKEAAKQLRWVE